MATFTMIGTFDRRNDDRDTSPPTQRPVSSTTAIMKANAVSPKSSDLRVCLPLRALVVSLSLSHASTLSHCFVRISSCYCACVSVCVCERVYLLMSVYTFLRLCMMVPKRVPCAVLW